MAQRLPRFRRYQELEEERRKLRRLLADVDSLLELDEPPKRWRSTAGGDHARLRGLPAVAPGVSGAVPGSDPLRALLSKESRRRR